jgi:hypothetical protein
VPIREGAKSWVKELRRRFDIRNDMNVPKRKRSARPRIRKPTNWRAKVHPFLVRMLEFNRKVADLLASANEADRAEGQRLSDNLTPELVAEAERMRDAIPKSERLRHDAHLSIYGAVDSKEETVIPEEQFLLGWLAWSKCGKTIVELVEGDEAGDEKSSRQLASVTKDYQDWRYGKLDPNRLRSKFDYHHLSTLRMCLDLGIETLTQEELADCFDEVCTCGETHDAENLRKLRTRVIEMMEKLTARIRPRTPKDLSGKDRS